MDRVQTKDVPHHPRFGGVIMGLYYHGVTQVHTPLVPTINSAVALWAFAHLYKNDALVTDDAMVHVMLLSRTRRDRDFALACWICSKNKIEELQLQILPGPGEPKFDAPGGFLFVNWKSPAPASRRAEEDSMRLRTAVIGMLTLASLASCGGYGGTVRTAAVAAAARGRRPGGFGDGRRRHPIRERPQRELECGCRHHLRRWHRHVDLDRVSAPQRPVRRLAELRE